MNEYDIRNQFVGTWTLHTGEVRDAQGELAVTLEGGLLHYSPEGLVSAQCVMSPSSPNQAVLQTLGVYLAYFGRWELLSDRPVVVHHVEGCNAPGYVGKPLARHYRFDGDRLTLSADVAAQTEVRSGTSAIIVWQRVSSAPSR